MPWKLIGIIALLVLVVIFASLNLSHRADISLGVYVFKEVPIFLSLFISFLLGILVMLPFTIGPSNRRKQIKKEKKTGGDLTTGGLDE